MITHDKNGNEMTVAVRSALPVDSPCARYTGFKQETLLLKKGSVRLKGYMPLPCDIILERDVPVTLRDGITIYTDIFRREAVYLLLISNDQKHGCPCPGCHLSKIYSIFSNKPRQKNGCQQSHGKLYKTGD